MVFNKLTAVKAHPDLIYPAGTNVITTLALGCMEVKFSLNFVATFLQHYSQCL